MESAKTRYVRNAAADILNMIEVGTVKVHNGTKTVRIKDFKHAKNVKLGKLHRVIRHIQASSDNAYRRMPGQYKEAINTWKRVIADVKKLTLTDCRRLTNAS